MKVLINASTDVNTLYDIAHDLFNSLMNNYRDELENHTADSIIVDHLTDVSDSSLSQREIDRVIEFVYDITDGYFATWDNYFGYIDQKKYGNTIIDNFKGWIISKRQDESNFIDYESQVAGLESVSEKLDIPIYSVLGALEGMCHENEACEISDSSYYVGSYSEYKRHSNV